MEERARYPEVAAKRGHYESFYIKACEPGGGRGIWIRHTVHKRPGAEPNGSIWFVFFDRAAAGPRATKVTVPGAQLSTPPGSWIRIADAEVGPGSAEGSIETEALTAAWSLNFDGDNRPCKYLPTDWLYEAPLPRTKFVAPWPDVRFEGRLTIDDEPLELSGWPGMIGHNWGTEHAERWVWLEGTGFEGSSGTYFDAGAARVALGSRVSPWIPSGMLMLDGEAHRLGGLGAIRSARIEESPAACSFVFPGKDVVVRGRVSAPEKDFVGWVYADPKGPEHNTVNCSVADLELTVERPGLPARELTLAAAGAYELGMRETDHGIPIQPYPDG
ncbi:MAG TPA: hypothetical protein VLL27_07670 [Solirubrobacterales bacterium]|nr:hypothetical protein [Solirubrobacterales bacterium]